MEEKQYIVVTDLWDGIKFHRPGQPFPTEGLPEQVLQRYIDKGFLDTQENVARKRNPEAFEERSAVAALTAKLQQSEGRVSDLEGQITSLTAQFPDVVTLDDLGTRITTLEAELKAARESQPDAQLQAQVQGLQDQLVAAQQGHSDIQTQLVSAEQTHADLQVQLATAQAAAARPEDAESLTRYQTIVGDLLPQGELSDATYQALLTSGYYTPRQIQAASDAELKKVQHLDAVGIGKLRAAYPKS